MKRDRWAVVSKDTKKTRENKSTSFSLTSEYEVGLLNYAEDPRHGGYSKFVKRLIDSHMQNYTPMTTATSSSPIVNTVQQEKRCKGNEMANMDSFL